MSRQENVTFHLNDTLNSHGYGRHSVSRYARHQAREFQPHARDPSSSLSFVTDGRRQKTAWRNHGASKTILNCFSGSFLQLSGSSAAILLSAKRPPIKNPSGPLVTHLDGCDPRWSKSPSQSGKSVPDSLEFQSYKKNPTLLLRLEIVIGCPKIDENFCFSPRPPVRTTGESSFASLGQIHTNRFHIPSHASIEHTVTAQATPGRNPLDAVPTSTTRDRAQSPEHRVNEDLRGVGGARARPYCTQKSKSRSKPTRDERTMLSDYRTSSTWPTGNALISLFALCPPFFPRPKLFHMRLKRLELSRLRTTMDGHRGPATLGTRVGAKDDLWFAQWGREKIDCTPNERLPMSLIYGASFHAGGREAEACGG
ncbi:uncharacterized protein CLUP02_03970 [Colletotrichum lupini]|uniref:Uncharacterized protein n=1 Tax=Colletotrichum lupini TaxID=145971 RepID=A0A9Q8SJU7_9PEZI|nr:uncharacterized protein CLUP02_03970 [Colletotrichum lupini]UQC78493.1 hypothetical protein CLUP02_03970 [Colletotrichum lupini]